MLCMRVYTRQYIWHISVPMLGGVLTALTDETIQIFSPGRSSQVTDVWRGFSRRSGGHPYGAGAHGAVQIVVQPS